MKEIREKLMNIILEQQVMDNPIDEQLSQQGIEVLKAKLTVLLSDYFY